MLQVTVPFTNEIVFDAYNLSGSQSDEVIINRYDEVRGAISISVKSFYVGDIAAYLIQLKSPESVLISARMEQPALMMSFILHGELSIISGSTGIGLHLAEDTHSSFIRAENTAMDVVIQGEVKLFAAGLSEKIINKLLDGDENLTLQSSLIEGAKRSHTRIITPAMHDILNTVIHCADNNCLHRVFLAAKVLDLLFLDIEQLSKTEEVTKQAIKTYDLEKLQLAKELIGKDLQEPCSLIELAHKVGLNDFKLKKGFKEAFGTTVFGHLADLRMETARKMLLSSEFTIGEVAHQVGYKNAHHFTAAFKKKFGYLPSIWKTS